MKINTRLLNFFKMSICILFKKHLLYHPPHSFETVLAGHKHFMLNIHHCFKINRSLSKYSQPHFFCSVKVIISLITWAPNQGFADTYSLSFALHSLRHSFIPPLWWYITSQNSSAFPPQDKHLALSPIFLSQLRHAEYCPLHYFNTLPAPHPHLLLFYKCTVIWGISLLPLLIQILPVLLGSLSRKPQMIRALSLIPEALSRVGSGSSSPWVNYSCLQAGFSLNSPSALAHCQPHIRCSINACWVTAWWHFRRLTSNSSCACYLLQPLNPPCTTFNSHQPRARGKTKQVRKV